MDIHLWAALFSGLALTLPGIAHAADTKSPELKKIERGSLDPRGEVHIPIGIADTVDTLKTFVESEGCFSPGVGSYGVYFWVYDPESRTFTAPTMNGIAIRYGLTDEGYLIPWSAWNAGDVAVKTEVCEVRRNSPKGELFVVGARAHLANNGSAPRKVSLYVALRSLGPAGWPVKELAVSPSSDALLVEGHPAIVAMEKPTAAGVLATDTIGKLATEGQMPEEGTATSESGDCSGALRFDLAIGASETKTLSFVCPVLPGRRAVGHNWDRVHPWFQLDLAKPNPSEGGILQADPGLEYYRGLSVDQLFQEAESYWKELVGPPPVKAPDKRWAEATAAITGHMAMCLNEGAPDLVVVSLNVFTRDSVYMTNFLQKSGHLDLARRFIDYLLAHPFSGRVQPEADNPGQILWILGEQWRFTRDEEWLQRVFPSVRKLAALIAYYRTTPGPHWVGDDTMDFGEALPVEKCKELKPGACDGHNPRYTEAFDIAGLRAAVMLAQATANEDDASQWSKLADSLFEKYDQQYGAKLAEGYGNYAVLWPCRLYPIGHGEAHEQFKSYGMRKTGEWRYFPLATAHQGLLAGNREAGCGTIASHLDEKQMRGWYAFDEGGPSGVGGWPHLRTTWSWNYPKPNWAPVSAMAMPDGWVLAEVWLLLRDCVLFEDGDRLVLLGGVDPSWFTAREGIAVESLPTYFGPCAFTYAPTEKGAALRLSGPAAPPGGFVLRLPKTLSATATVDGKPLQWSAEGDVLIPSGTKRVEIAFPQSGKQAIERHTRSRRESGTYGKPIPDYEVRRNCAVRLEYRCLSVFSSRRWPETECTNGHPSSSKTRNGNTVGPERQAIPYSRGRTAQFQRIESRVYGADVAAAQCVPLT